MAKNPAAAPTSPFDPEKLDPILLETAEALGKNLAAWGKLEPLVSDWIEALTEEVAAARQAHKDGTPLVGATGQPTASGAFVRQLMADLSGFLERFSKISLNLTKALDEGSRLRSFLGGGPDSRPELTSLSDKELLDILVQAAVARGLGPIIAAKMTALS